MRRKITAVATLAVIVVLLAASAGLVVSQRRLLTENLDEGLTGRADEIEALAEGGRVPPTITGLGEDDTVAQVVVGGTVTAASANVAGRGPLAAAPATGQRLRTVTGLPHDDADFRLLSRRIGPDGAILHVAGTLDDIDESRTVLITSLSVVVPAVALLLAGLVWWLVGRTLRPVEAIRAEVAEIGGSDLDRRVPVPESNDEIAGLARTMNTMLERVDAASRRQARFVADASHELRSPLTRIRSELEVDLSTAGESDLAATHRSILEEAVGLQHLVEDLLQLARSDAAVGPPPGACPVDLDDIVLGQARRLRSHANLTVDIADVAAVQVLGHSGQLTRAVGNLADNAARYAATTVALTLVEHGRAAVLAVVDDGPGIPPEDHERVFERFARLDDARTAATGGSGLGLAIARDIVERHGGTLVIDPDHHPGARVVLTLPLGMGVSR